MSERKKAKIRTIIAILLAVIMAGMVVGLFVKAIPGGNKDAYNILLGFIGGSFMSMVSYYFGDSQGSGGL